MMIQVLSASIILLHYMLNKEFITEQYCVNKAKPELKCNGQCHLKKEIEADANHKSDLPAAPSELMTFALVCQSIAVFDFSPLSLTPSQLNGHYIMGEYLSSAISIFHPPRI